MRIHAVLQGSDLSIDGGLQVADLPIDRRLQGSYFPGQCGIQRSQIGTQRLDRGDPFLGSVQGGIVAAE